MKPRYLDSGQTPDGHAQHRWMVSYLDVLTIVLVFFIAVAARALQPVAPSPAGQPPAAPPPAIFPEPASLPSEALVLALHPSPNLDQAQKLLQDKGLDLRREQWGLVISLPQAILFPSGDERIETEALPVVAEIAQVLRGIPNRVNLAGNTDSVPIHNQRFHSNWELSAARGMALLDLLASRYSIDEARLSVTSYGSFHPRDSNDTPAGRAENRRVEITILDEAR